MSLSSPTGQRALDVPSTPSSPLTEASLGRARQVLTQAPLGTQKAPRTRLAIVADTAGSVDLTVLYFTQVYGWPRSAVVHVSSWDDVTREFNACSSIGELVFLTHAIFDVVDIGGTQLTTKQFADRFAGTAPPIGSLSFDGCVIGTALPGMHYIATTMTIPEVRGYTWWHYMDRWRMFPTGTNAAESLALFQPLAAVASPWLPKSVDGRTVITPSEQVTLFSANKLNVFAEYFHGDYDGAAKPDFITAVQNGTLDPTRHVPRVSAATRLVDSAGAQTALEIELTPYPPPFCRVVMTPWA